MRHLSLVLVLAFLTSSLTCLEAQSFASHDEGGSGVSPASPVVTAGVHPFSRFAFGGEVSPLGIGATVTTNLNRHLNLRADGSLLNYSTTFNTNGFNASAQLKLASERTSLDIYPFRSGFRISPGVMLYNQNRVTASDTVASGTSFTLNLHSSRPAFTITGGWGNPLAHRGHWSFPVEVGVGFVGTPSLNANLAGWACYDQAQTQCMNIANPTNPIAIEVQNDLHSQIGKWNQDLNPLRTYPIVSAGVNYSFRIGPR